MHAVAVVRASSGELVPLHHGALIGRLWSADLHINDPRVSEAHAMISVRGRDVHMIALRGRMLVDGTWSADVVLVAGMTVTFAHDVAIEIADVRVPDTVLALEADGLARQVLSTVTSLYGGTAPRLVAGWQAGADDHVWPDGESWMRTTGAPTPIAEGDAWEVAGTRFRVVMLRAEGAPPTHNDPAYALPIRIVARWDTVHLVREGAPTAVITGHMAHVLSELATTRAPIAWQELASLRWKEGDRDLLRHRWDMQLRRLRRKLSTHGLRTDLIRADGSGLVELVLGPGDTIVDET
ncbi:MAG: FHA domain-containing protein [Kofleriaceae bacterium]|nr:FHA domain-containing protein [Kofleriaceae bacterium]